jgi:hypothetical protein
VPIFPWSLNHEWYHLNYPHGRHNSCDNKGNNPGVDEFIVLPHKSGSKNAFSNKALKFSKSKVLEKSQKARKLPPGILGEAAPRDGDEHDVDIEAAQRTVHKMEDSELKKEKSAHRRGDKIAEDESHLHFLLAREMRHMLRNVSESPDKRYAYEEWTW